MENPKIRIDAAEVADPRVDAVLAQQGSFGMGAAPARLPDRKASLLYRPWFALMIAGALGGLAGWAVIEPFYDDGLRIEGRVEQVSPGPMGEPTAEVRVSGVLVLVSIQNTRILLDGAPVPLDRLEGAKRVTVLGRELERGQGSALL